ncbi:MAG: hypothetical protein V3U16_01220 [Candidatus Neomarinimicrobiota bacterium]
MKNLISLFLLTPILIFSQVPEEKRDTKIRQINLQIGAGVEYANNSEFGIFGQYNLNDNISFIGKIRNCTHDDKVYFSPGVKYYFNNTFYDIIPFIDIRYEKVHYDLKWSDSGYGYDRRYNPLTDQYEWYQIKTTNSGSSIINTQALSISGGGEYKINNIGINTSLGISYYTKIEGDSDEKTKLSFTIGVLYYFGK